MELPITRPSMISYADQLNFNELLGKLKSKEYNGFIRVTAGSEEGHILFKEGIQIAASYDNDSKIDAIKKIKSATDNSSTLIEVFDLRDSQVNYLMDINKKYLLNSGSEVNDVLDELKKTGHEDKEKIENITPEKPEVIETPILEEKPEVIEAPLTEEKPEVTEATLPEEKPEISESPLLEQNESFLPKKPEINEDIKVEPEIQDSNEEVKNKLKSISEMKSNHVEDVRRKTQIKSGNTDISPASADIDGEKADKGENEEMKAAEVVNESIDRAELMKKYGLKDVGEEEVENILESYKGGSLSDDDVEKIELTLMNKIKKSILSIPKIKGTEVMVFLDNTSELAGTINIITEYESKGFLSRFMGESKDLDNLKKQIINITQIEIKKSFRGYPEIVNNFKINVEVS
ncbi:MULTISPECIES: DUF2226 domain-containing protein [Methanobacterium]|uniref:DUF4388 domain-containing protein n=1 Tax=Methanobacterium bryantii TaxID=2161 RepID=A0A2A2H2J3_METBR|nr:MULTISPECIES: DUF2226 domain-containing protein [Methanobacterium]OEC88171.1 hypothetical protein A9507_06335 [Methanobacterium sp. A39]PAV03575.1 hypothetical protein ASJ80_01070 [Methanobacterium bryantii]